MAKKTVELPSREELISLAQEVNAVLNLEVAIKFGKKVTDEELAAAIIKETKNNVYEIDFVEDAEDVTIPVYSEEAAELFEVLGIKVLPGSPNDDAPAKEEEPEEAPEPTATAKKGATKEKVEKVKVEKAPKEEKVKASKAEKEDKYTRYTAFADVIKNGKMITIADLDKKTDDLYSKNGGNSNIEQSGRINYRCVLTLMALDLMEKTKAGVKYLG